MWKVRLDDRARRELRKLGAQTQSDILRYLGERIAKSDDPRRFGKSLSYDKYGLWRYRVGDYRMLCRIDEKESTILVVAIGHRKNIYV